MKKERFYIEDGENKIPCSLVNLKIERNEVQKIVLACHGFCSSKDSESTIAVFEMLENSEIPLLSFDWPGHGDNGEVLTLANCIHTFNLVEDYIKREFPHASIELYGSSFGGYMVLTVLGKRVEEEVPPSGKNVFLKSPAIRMDQILKDSLIVDTMDTYKEQGYTISNKNNIKIPYLFYEELCENILTKEKVEKLPWKILAFHGNNDDIAPFKDVMALRGDNFEVIELEKAPHSFGGSYRKDMAKKVADILNE